MSPTFLTLIHNYYDLAFLFFFLLNEKLNNNGQPRSSWNATHVNFFIDQQQQQQFWKRQRETSTPYDVNWVVTRAVQQPRDSHLTSSARQDGPRTLEREGRKERRDELNIIYPHIFPCKKKEGSLKLGQHRRSWPRDLQNDPHEFLPSSRPSPFKKTPLLQSESNLQSVRSQLSTEKEPLAPLRRQSQISITTTCHVHHLFDVDILKHVTLGERQGGRVWLEGKLERNIQSATTLQSKLELPFDFD